MIANFQTYEVAERYRNMLRRNGWFFASMLPYRGGWQVNSGYIRLYFQ